METNKKLLPHLLATENFCSEREGERGEGEKGEERRKNRKTLLATEKFLSRERDRVEKLTLERKFSSREKEEEGRRLTKRFMRSLKHTNVGKKNL